MPRVGIGVPTYNGARVIAEGLQCLQDQDFEDFEVCISDNGSTDGTSDICADFARSDPRFKHFRFDETIPAGQNFSRARDLTHSPYFMWRADDDLADRGFLAGLVSALDQNSGAVLAAGPIFRTFTDGSRPDKLVDVPNVDGTTRADRIRAFLLGCHPSWFYGLWRREHAVRDWDMVLQRYPYLWASDHLAMLPAILDEKVVLVRGARFIQRIERQATYHLPPEKLLEVRKVYARLADEMMALRDWEPDEQKRVKKIVHDHIDDRVAQRFANIRRVWKKRLRSLIAIG